MIRLITLRLVETYFRHRWLYLLPILIMIGFGGYYLANLELKYVAQGVLNISNNSLLSTLTALPNNNSSWWISPSQAVSNEVWELLRTDAFIRAVIKETDLENEMAAGPEAVNYVINDVRENIWMTPLGDNQLQITAQNLSPEVAYQLVNSVIQNYLQWKGNASRLDSQTAQEYFGNLITEYKQELESARQVLINYLIAHPEPVKGERPILETFEIDRLQKEVDLAEARYTSVLNREEDARLIQQQKESDIRQTYVLIDAPVLPTTPEISKKKLAANLAIFLAVGAIIFIGLVAGTTILDRTIRFPSEIRDQFDLPVLGVIQDTKPALRWQWLRKLFSKKTQGVDQPLTADQIADIKGGLETPGVDKGADATS